MHRSPLVGSHRLIDMSEAPRWAPHETHSIVQIRGVVVAGDRRGRILGVPTANLSVDDLAIPLRFGVYAGLLDGMVAAVSIGVRPTFGEGLTVLLEAHVLDMSLDLYGRTVTVSLLQRLRDERVFASTESLVEQMQIDLRECRSVCDDLVGRGALVPI
jgi:riboflavin kinase/FMN adenylyltransferase